MQSATNSFLNRFIASIVPLEPLHLEVRVAAAVIAVTTLLCLAARLHHDGTVHAPFVGYRSFWEPTFILRLRFVTGAWPIIMDGYSQFKDSMFKIRRNDTDILVISKKYVDELRALPDEKASAIGAHVKNLLGPYSTTDLLLDSDLHTRVLQTKLSPNLSTFIGPMREELGFAMGEEIPMAEDWTEVAIHEIALRVVARISARVFLGTRLCRNEEWIQASIEYTENIFMTVIALRAFPSHLHPIIVRFLPSWYRIHQNLRTAKKLICPIIEEHNISSEKDKHAAQQPTLLKWMIETATLDIERDPRKLAHRQLIMSLGSIHTTTMATAHFFYDLCARPEYWDPLREEITECMEPDGSLNKQSLLKMRKMESFMKESQRLNPPSLLAFNRIIKQPMTLSDGVYLPRGTHVAVASAPILMDAAVVPDPETFDPLRSYRKRQQPGEVNKHLWAMTDKENLHFGHGKFSCPGRFFASNEIKMIISRILIDYDLKYPEGKSRPQNFTADENVYPDPTAKLLIRRRRRNAET